MKPWKIVTLSLAYALTIGVLVGWQLPSRATAADPCNYSDCGEDEGPCQLELCCRNSTCGPYPIMRFWVGRRYETCSPTQKCISSLICAYQCTPTE